MFILPATTRGQHCVPAWPPALQEKKKNIKDTEEEAPVTRVGSVKCRVRVRRWTCWSRGWSETSARPWTGTGTCESKAGVKQRASAAAAASASSDGSGYCLDSPRFPTGSADFTQWAACFPVGARPEPPFRNPVRREHPVMNRDAQQPLGTV